MARRSDIILALVVVAITAMLLVPLPTVLLDFLLAANISFALLLLLVGLYMPNALALLAFPSILLLTTLFRLALNIASTRLILSDGNAGRVIEAFGTFLIRGEILVGIIIFTIITIVNFIVIARGSARVSEVAARFALDSLPGKQMAIDADLRAGLLSAEQAQQRRDDLRKESQLYGSMDGAMKFVQGDAIAGLFIIVINIVAGIYLGVAGGMSFSDAAQTYTVLTVGDGLVSQIPALLISVCAGIVVTRVSSGENTTLGSDVGVQLLQRPGALIFAGCLAALISLLPGLPTAPFLLMGTLLILGGLWMQRTRGQFVNEFAVRREQLPSAVGGLLGFTPSSLDDRQSVEGAVLLHLDAAMLYRLYKMNAPRYRAWWADLQADFYHEHGIRLPELRVLSDDQCAPSRYAFVVGDAVAGTGAVLLDAMVVEVNPEQAAVLGLEVISEVEHPLSGERVFWAAQSPSLRKILEAGNIRAFDFFEFIALHIAAFYQQHPEEVLSLTDVHGMLKALEKKYPGLIADALNREYMTLSRLTDVLQELIRQGVGIRDFKSVVESVAAYCSSFGARLGAEDGFDVHDVVAFVRLARKRHILARLKTTRGSLKVVTLNEEAEQVLARASLDSASGGLGLSAEDFESLRRGLRAVLDPLRQHGLAPIAVLASPDVRSRIVTFLRAGQSSLPVLSFAELDTSVRIENVAQWALG
ncbi:MAG: flagellar biosynthesis protein FlhA [Oligoflexia bacterium]|nr:flagellar biosynthesis protein FlhA [Oligoflexia bacterium]